jgi:hypothetical protein
MEKCRVLVLKMRGSNFPVKDSGIEGNKADPFYTLRSQYVLQAPHQGEHKNNPYVYKSKKVRQDLNPRWKSIAIDLETLCNMDMNRKLLVDIYDWDRYSEPDFMSYVELSAQQVCITCVRVRVYMSVVSSLTIFLRAAHR